MGNAKSLTSTSLTASAKEPLLISLNKELVRVYQVFNRARYYSPLLTLSGTVSPPLLSNHASRPLTPTDTHTCATIDNSRYLFILKLVLALLI